MRGNATFFWNGRPFFSVVGGDRRFRISASKRIKGNTIKKAMAKLGLYVIFFLRIEKLFSKNDSDIESYITHINKYSQFGSVKAVLLWPTNEKRSRCYVYLSDEVTNRVVFTKLAFCETNMRCLENEYLSLRRVEKYGFCTFCYPKIMYASFDRSDRALLMTECMKSSYNHYDVTKNPYPEEILSEFTHNKKEVLLKDVLKEEWWQYFRKKIKNRNQAFGNAVNKCIDCQIERKVWFCFVHGDFGSENFFFDKEKRFYLIDWECCREFGPILTDRIGFWLGKNHRRIRLASKEGAYMYMEEFVDNRSVDDAIDAILALIYMYSMDFNVAESIVDNFSLGIGGILPGSK